MTNPVPVLHLQNVTRSFPSADGSVTVLRGINLTVDPGEFLMITGPSGSGKSTILNIAALLDPPTSGEIRFLGKTISPLAERDLCEIRKQQIGMVFQKFCLLPHRSVLENVMFRFRYFNEMPADATTAAHAVLHEMGLRNIMARQTRLLSAGEMQRTAIARAVVFKPAILLADEPTGNLDGESTRTVMHCFKKLNSNGLTIIMVTHNTSLLEFCSRHQICREGILE